MDKYVMIDDPADLTWREPKPLPEPADAVPEGATLPKPPARWRWRTIDWTDRDGDGLGVELVDDRGVSCGWVLFDDRAQGFHEPREDIVEGASWTGSVQDSLDRLANAAAKVAAAYASVEWTPDHATWPALMDSFQGERLLGQDALALLLTVDQTVSVRAVGGRVGNAACCPVVNCNDFFYFACADAEPIPHWRGEDADAFWRLYDWTRAYGGYGALAWAVWRRQKRPLPSKEAMLREAGVWHLTGLADGGEE